MIFQHTLEQVLSGRKSQTRRRAAVSDAAVYGDDGQIVAVRHNGRTKWAVGKTYAVQPGRNLPQVARIRVTGIRRQKVTDISAADAVAEGYDTREQFLAAWVYIHGAGAADADTWAIAFTLVEASPKS